jgi:signal transduction histidine kinase
MPSPSRSAKRLSIRHVGFPGLLVAGTVVWVVVAGAGLIADSPTLAVLGLVGATAFAGSFAVYLIVSERRRHEVAEDHLTDQARFLESLVGSMGALAGSHSPGEILDRTCTEAVELFGARSAEFLPAADVDVVDAHEIKGGLHVPLRAGKAPIGTLELRRSEPFHRVDLIRAAMLADFASRAVENVRLLEEAREREDERARLTERLITAEQDERRRLSIFLHDGPLQSMSGIALMHDAALNAIREGRIEDAEQIVASSLDRERDTIRNLRDLSFAIEPLVLRDQGFAAAVGALREQIEGSYRITVAADVDAGEELAEKAQVALYQLIREAVNQAVGRKPERITITVASNGDGFVTEIGDDGTVERRRSGIGELDERVRVLNGSVEIDSNPEAGTTVRVILPPYAAGRA